MAKYIDIQSVYGLIDDLERNPDVSQYTKSLLLGVRDFLVTLPTEDVALIKHAKWVEDERNGEHENYHVCSKCGNSPHFDPYDNEETLTPYCAYCGAKMDEKKESAESEWEYDGPTLYLGKPPETGATSHYICSKCMHGIHTNKLSEYKYCPGCGAKMKAEGNV